MSVDVQAALADAYLKAAKEADELRAELARVKLESSVFKESWQDALERERALEEHFDAERDERQQSPGTDVCHVVVYDRGEQCWVGNLADWHDHALEHGIDKASVDDHFAFRGRCVQAASLPWPSEKEKLDHELGPLVDELAEEQAAREAAKAAETEASC